jgi:TolB-like protein
MSEPEIQLSRQEVMDHLTRVLSSASMMSSGRHRKFLSFAVEETLAGRADRLKAYTIATGAFGRADDFDPQQDSIVRIEAGRLRRALEHYYLTDGAADRLRIVIPKGTYVPRFELAAVRQADPQQVAARGGLPPPGGQVPRLFVCDLEQEGDLVGRERFAAGVTRQLIMGLMRVGGVQVFGKPAGKGRAPQQDPHQVSPDYNPDYVLSGTVLVDADELIVDLLMQERPSGHFVWTGRFGSDLVRSELIHLRNEIADQIVEELAQPHGILHRSAAGEEGEVLRHLAHR